MEWLEIIETQWKMGWHCPLVAAVYKGWTVSKIQEFKLRTRELSPESRRELCSSGREGHRLCVKDELKLVLHCWSLQAKNSSEFDNPEWVWLKFKTSRQAVTVGMQCQHTDKLTVSYRFCTELLETTQKLDLVHEPIVFFGRAGLVLCLCAGREVSPQVSAQQLGFGSANAALGCYCNTSP